MAKKKKGKADNAEEATEEKKEGVLGKILTIFVVLLIIIIWLAIFALLIKFDVGGFGSKVLRPILKDVPIISAILPDVPDETLANENNYPYRNLAEAMQRIEELEAQLAEQNDSENNNQDYIAQLEAEVERLKVFEENQTAFEERVKEFDKNVVFNDRAPELEEYKAYYEQIAPENAEEIYRQVVQQIQADERIKEQAAMFKAMKPADAAAILETMTGDLDLVAKILMNMKTKESGAILAEMSNDMAAKITKKISVLEME